MKYDLVIVMGRFEPLHVGHQVLFEKAKTLAPRTLVLIGSAGSPSTIKNPFSYHEREEMITLTYPDVFVRPVVDYIYNHQRWLTEVNQTVNDLCRAEGLSAPKIAVVGYEKDKTSFYLNDFPQWDLIKVNSEVSVDATNIRNLLFANGISYIKSVVPSPVYAYIKNFLNTEKFQSLLKEFEYIRNYRAPYASLPFPPTFFTVDSMVVQSGHVLLIERKHEPGKGLWALPGGFVEQDETSREAALRELREEVGIKVPPNVLSRCITHEKLFDYPQRSLRGRTFTQVYLIELTSVDGTLPKCKAGSDAKSAKWFTFAEIENMSSMMFEDHFSIIQNMQGLVK